MKKFILLLIIPFFVLSQSKKELSTLLEKANNKIETIQLELDEMNDYKKLYEEAEELIDNYLHIVRRIRINF